MTSLFDRPRRRRPPSTEPTAAVPWEVLAAEARLFADVVFDRPLDQAYTYAVPRALEGSIGVGKRVEVPLGRGRRTSHGFCVRLSEQGPPATLTLKPVLRVVDERALVDDHLLQLTRWMADYYLCGWGQVLHAVVPASVREQAGTRRVAFVGLPPSEQQSPGEPLAEQASPDEHLPGQHLPAAASPGQPSPVASPPVLTHHQQAVLDFLRQQSGPVPLQVVLREVGCSAGVVHSLVQKGLVVKSSRRVAATAAAPAATVAEPDAAVDTSPVPTLNADQQRVWETVAAAIAAGGFRPFLLYGVTGSGKTEIYLRAIEAVLRQGQQAIVLVPEIALTPQTIARFRGRCGQVAVLHSHLTDAERNRHWQRIAAGEVQVVVGARSAVFAPTPRLGLIVIDEEHEHTYKQESTPRYHGRDVAVMRAHLARIPIIMGSATPSLESWWNAQRGQYTLLSLPQRVESRPLPTVKIIDLRHEPHARGPLGAISPTLEAAMLRALKSGGQVMLLLNRRGFSTYVHCHACGHVLQCEHCDIALTFHRTKSALVCHYCGWETPPRRDCPACHQPTLRYQGRGTEKLQAEIEEKFPGYVCRRMDSDTMTRPGSHQAVLDAFRAGDIHILLGTQMIAKGLDFPNVTLVGVIQADTGLHLPDFRSAERTFQLLAQVAGRTGRGDKGGSVFIQTFTPEHPAIAWAARHDYVRFAGHELAQRQQHRYPPFERLARIIVRSTDESAASAFAETVGQALQRAAAALTAPAAATPPATPAAGSSLPTASGEPSLLRIRILGPVECPVYRLNDYYRFQLQVQSADSGQLHAALRRMLGIVRPPSRVEMQIDIDPYHML